MLGRAGTLYRSNESDDADMVFNVEFRDSALSRYLIVTKYAVRTDSIIIPSVLLDR